VDISAAVILAAALLVFAGGLTALGFGRSFRATLAVRFIVPPAALLGLAGCVSALLLGVRQDFALPWPLPLGNCLFRVDPLSAFFLVPVFFLSALAALVLPERAGLLQKQIHAGRHCFFFCTLASGMALTVLAADGIFFLLLWEIMSLAPFFLIAHSDENSDGRFASWIYLIAAHLGALPLLLLFSFLTIQAGSSDFAAYMVMPAVRHAGFLFILGLIGFGAKCGLFPLHMWMPEAHSSAPGHVAVLLSGTMLNIGLYGILRLLSLLGPPDIVTAYILLAAGGLSGIMGILLGLGQADMKRSLAYSSAENMGIILLAAGGAVLAAHHNAPAAMVLLLTGLLLHIWNHSVFKSLLFLGANAVKENTHTTMLHRLGGLGKLMPFTGGCFAAGSASIAGVPPLNGFMGELLLYCGFALGAEAAKGTDAALLFWVAFFTLGTIAGFSLFTFSRVYGLAFLGAPRGSDGSTARDPDAFLKSAMFVLAGLCLGVSLAGPLLLRLLTPLLAWFSELLSLAPPAEAAFAMPAALLQGYAWAGCGLFALLAVIFLARSRIMRGNPEATVSDTWGCGYTAPSARIQYTGGSFSFSLSLLLRPLIRPQMFAPALKDIFPGPAGASVSSPDWPTAVWTRLFFRPVTVLSEQAKNLQHGLLNIYILYILIALMAALVWALGRT
jgi:formate hydrogenlyase subunit 3/multisubunit Na+/H+ antiporter MnhD subunit